jgi:GDPmannose 4,6-dehydratase
MLNSGAMARVGKTAIITGITGQDGAYLAAHLLDHGYRVIGAFRRSSTPNFWRLAELGVEHHERLSLVDHDLTDLGASIRLLQESEPHEIYNLAAQSFVATSFKEPVTTAEITGIGALNMLEAIRIVDKRIRFYQASSSEMFGKVQATPQREDTPFYPRSPYGVAKLFAHWSTVNYRESYGIFATSGILFNHESPLRGKEFVTRKITDAAAAIQRGQLDVLRLGNLDAIRDWGYAKEYVAGMHLMLQHATPDTFVLATGKTWSVRRFTEAAFAAVGIKLRWQGAGETEQGVDVEGGRVRVVVDPRFYRPAEVDVLQGDASKAKRLLGWQHSTSIDNLAALMVEADLRRRKHGEDRRQVAG